MTSIPCPRGCGREFTLVEWLARGAAHVVFRCPANHGKLGLMSPGAEWVEAGAVPQIRRAENEEE